MRHFVLPARQSGKSIAAQLLATTPLTPAAYFQLRRKAAGADLDQLARALVTVLAHGRPLTRRKPSPAELGRRYMAMRDTVALLERRGSLCLDGDLLDAVRSVMPFDPDVYRQLATAPADRLPRICRSCGCSDHDQCSDDHSCCSWSTPALCSHCVEGGLRVIATREAA